MKKICFRVDANAQIGQGHAMRCLSIAQYAKKHHIFTSIFAVADRDSALFFEERGIQCMVLSSNFQCYSVEEAEKLLSVLQKEDVDQIFVDSYYLTNEYIKKIQTHYKVACFWCKAEVLDADLLINYNINYDREFYHVHYRSHLCKLLLGTRYIPLREEFTVSRQIERESQIDKILILSGGSAPKKLIQEFVQVANALPQFKFTLINGTYHDADQQGNLPDNLHMIGQSSKVSERMLENDIVVSAGGTTMYELCALGIPSVIYTMADNQIGESEYLGKLSCVKYIGDIRENKTFTMDLCNALRELHYHNDMRTQMVEHMRSIVDGKGCERIAKALSEM